MCIGMEKEKPSSYWRGVDYIMEYLSSEISIIRPGHNLFLYVLGGLVKGKWSGSKKVHFFEGFSVYISSVLQKRNV